MAESKKIKGSDLIVPGYLKMAIEEAEHFLKVIKETKQIIIDTNKATAQKMKGAEAGTAAKDLKEANTLMNESIKQRKLIAAAQVAELKATTDLDKAKKAAADFNKKKLADDERTIKATEKQNSAYAQTSAKLNQLRKDYKDLAIAGKGADQATQDLLKTIQMLDKELKEVDASVGQFNRSVGDYKNQMKGAIAESEVLKDGLNKLGDSSNAAIAGFSGVVNQLKKIKEAQAAATTGAGKLGNALKIGGIGLLLSAFAALGAFFGSSREGGMELDLILNKLKGTLDILVGSIAKIGKALVGFGTAIKLAFSGDFAGALSAAGKAMDDITKAFDGNLDAIEKQIEGYDRLTKAIIQFEDDLRILQVAQEKAKMDEEDYNEITQDSTATLIAQKAALEGAIGARLKAAKIGNEIATKEFDLASMELELTLRKNKVSEEDIKLAKEAGFQNLTSGKLHLKVTNEELNKINEKYLAQLHAADVLEDLDRQEGERRRKIIQDEVIAEVELLRSKKLGADAQVQILTKQVNDEKFQLEERVQFEEELRKKQLAAQAEEVHQLAKFRSAIYDANGKAIEQSISEEEINSLIAEKDAVRLARRIKDTKLSVTQQEELAKVILEAQKTQLDYDDQLKKNEEERVKRLEKIAKLEQEIAIINENQQLDLVTSIEERKRKILDDSNNKILQGNNAFNHKMEFERRKNFLLDKAAIEEKERLQRDLLDKQYILDQQAIEQSENDEQVKNKALEKLDAQHNAQVAKLEIDLSKQRTEFNEKEKEQLRLIEIRKTEIIVDALAKVTQALQAELANRQQIQSQNVQKQLDKTSAEIERQRDLANKGLANTLAYQEQLLEKEQLKQQDLQKRQQKQQQAVQLAEALLNAYNAELKQPNATPTLAAAKALGDVLLFKGLAAGLVQFAAEGNDRVQGPGTQTSDSIPFMLSKDEGVVKASANMDNPGVVAALNDDSFDKLYMPKYNLQNNLSDNTGNNIANSLMFQTNQEIISLLKDIKSKPVQQVDVDGLGQLVETVYLDGMKTVTKFKNKRSIG